MCSLKINYNLKHDVSHLFLVEEMKSDRQQTMGDRWVERPVGEDIRSHYISDECPWEATAPLVLQSSSYPCFTLLKSTGDVHQEG